MVKSYMNVTHTARIVASTSDYLGELCGRWWKVPHLAAAMDGFGNVELAKETDWQDYADMHHASMFEALE